MANYLQCNAKSKRTGEQCRARAVIGSTKCYHHGGKTPKGVASPNYQTGRYSKYLPARLLERYEESAADGELLALREEIALLDSRLADLLKRVDSGEAGQAWKDAKAAHRKLTLALQTKDTQGMLTAVSELEAAIGKGHGDYLAWNEIQTTLDQRRRLVESERKRLVDMQQMVTSEQAMLLVTALLDAVRKNVHDRDTLTAVQAEFIRLTTQSDRQRLNAGNATE